MLSGYDLWQEITIIIIFDIPQPGTVAGRFDATVAMKLRKVAGILPAPQPLHASGLIEKLASSGLDINGHIHRRR